MGGLTLFTFCVLVKDLLGAMHNLAQPLLLFCPPLSCSLPLLTIPLPLIRSLALCSLHFYDLQEFFTMWYLQCPPISLGHRRPPLEALALCSVSPPLPRLKPSSTAHPLQRPLDSPLCPLLSLPLSTAARRRSCTAPLHPRSLCLPLLPFTLSSPPLLPYCLILHPHAQTVCLTPLSTSRGHSPPTPYPHLCPLSLLLCLLCLHPLCPPLPRVLLPCTTHLDRPCRPLAALPAVGECGGLKVCTVATRPSCLVPGLDRVWGKGRGGGHQRQSVDREGETGRM